VQTDKIKTFEIKLNFLYFHSLLNTDGKSRIAFRAYWVLTIDNNQRNGYQARQSSLFYVVARSLA